MFVALTDELRRKGFTRYSARAILHRIRWHYHVERGEREFKCNNNWTPMLAREYMTDHPGSEGFFETRVSPGNGPTYARDHGYE
jgi:hypothetical protein